MPGQLVGTQCLALLGQGEERIPAINSIKEGRDHFGREPSTAARLVLVPGRRHEPEEPLAPL